MIVMLYILYTTYQRHKADKSFWKKQDEISDEFLKQAKAQSDAIIAQAELATTIAKGDVAIEQKDTDKE